MNAKSSLFINSLEIELFLGWPSEERMRKQVVRFDVELQLPAIPAACTSDDLQDTVCYHELIKHLRAQIGAKKYHLIEHVTQDVYDIIKAQSPAGCNIIVKLTKQPQIQGLGSVTFKIHDEHCI